MKGIGKQPIQILCLLAVILTACGQSSTQRTLSHAVSISKNGAGIIGGEPVENGGPQFGEKVLYLALGVSRPKAAKVNWSGHCTASAIAPRVILTAAHCVVDRKLEEMEIVLTQNPSLSPYEPKDWYSTAAVRVHEGYTGSEGYLNDLALILLKRDLPESKILKLGNEDQITVPMEMLAVGYGTSSELRDETEQAKNSSILNSVTKFVTSIDASEKTFSINQNDHKGFCSGDSGGPGLIFDAQAKEYYIVGVVSNVSMLNEQRKMMDPEGRFSLCIGQGNYTNVLNPELRNWIDTNETELLAKN